MDKPETFFETTKSGEIQEIEVITGLIVSRSPSIKDALVGKELDQSVIHGKTVKWVYSERWKELICNHIASSKTGTLSSLYALAGTPSCGVVARWRADNPDFNTAITMAKRSRAERAYEQIIEDTAKDEILSKDEVPGAKLRFEKLKYQAKMDYPQEYNEKNEGGGGDGGVTIIIDTGIRRAGDDGVPPIEVKPTTIDGELADD